MTTIADLPLKPRVFFLDTHHDYGLSISASSLAFAMHEEANNEHLTFAWLSSPVDAIVEEFLSPLYEDVASPLRPGDIVRAKWEDPMAESGGLSPKSLSQVISLSLPSSILPSLLNLSLRDMLVGGDPDLHVVVPDAEAWSIDETLAKGDIPANICCAVRIRPDDNKTYLLSPLLCQSINLRINSSLTNPKLIAELIPTSVLTPARV